jgi:hypothetical protein
MGPQVFSRENLLHMATQFITIDDQVRLTVQFLLNMAGWPACLPPVSLMPVPTPSSFLSLRKCLFTSPQTTADINPAVTHTGQHHKTT